MAKRTTDRHWDTPGMLPTVRYAVDPGWFHARWWDARPGTQSADGLHTVRAEDHRTLDRRSHSRSLGAVMGTGCWTLPVARDWWPVVCPW
jgi:hypothetical protein